MTNYYDNATGSNVVIKRLAHAGRQQDIQFQIAQRQIMSLDGFQMKR